LPRALFITILLICSLNILSQRDYFPLQQDYIREVRGSYTHLDSLTHTSVLPFNIHQTVLEDSFFFATEQKYYSQVLYKLLKDDLIKVDQKDFKLRVNPVLDFSAGKDLLDTAQYADTTLFFQNTRGFLIDGQIGKRLFFHTSFTENQAYLPGWQKDYADLSLVIPGAGRHKAYKDNGFDYAVSSGWVSYHPIKNLNLFFGHGKLFSGHGYRSHHLSHQSFNYPHLKLSTTLLKGRLKVMWSIAELQSLERKPLGEVPESLFKQKGATFSSISYLLGKRTEVSVFESNVWRRFDNDLGSVAMPFKAHLPVPVLNYALQNDSSSQNSRLGFNLKVKISNKLRFYSQYQLETEGVQLGIATNNIFLKGLNGFVEFNRASGIPNSGNLLDFTHFNENLGHPLNTRFDEYIISLSFRKNRWHATNTLVYIQSESDRITNKLTANYLVNPKSNFNLQLGVVYREENRIEKYRSCTVFLGLRTALFDTLFDF